MKKIEVKLINNPYNIFIETDIIKNAGNLINELLPVEKHRKVFIITDKNLEKFGYLNYLEKSLNEIGYETFNIIVPSGEKSKSFKTFQTVSEKILQNNITRKDFLIALGGGVIGDLTGFLASVLLRGVSFVQIPTTLLSMVDSSVGGKTAINSNGGKNLIGTFYQPKIVLIDPICLKTLPKKELKSGYAEVVKYGIIMDREFFEYCEKNCKKCINMDLDVCETIIAKSCECKAKIVEQDEFETKGLRAILNFGHTFGHVHEKMSNYKIKHGEAVGLGMEQASVLSLNMGLCKQSDVDRILNHFKDVGLFSFSQIKYSINPDDFIRMMLKDKKADQNKLNLVLLNSIGNAELYKNVPVEKIKDIVIF